MRINFILLTLLLTTLLATPLKAQNSNDVKKVAILETLDREGTIGYGIELMVRSSLAYAITNTPGYEGYDRVNIASILGEHDFQRTGMVNDEQIKKLGEMTGAAYILVAEVAKIDEENIFITATILNVENAKLEQTTNVQSPTSAEEIGASCQKLANLLFNPNAQSYYSSNRQGSRVGGNSYNNKNNNSYNNSNNGYNYTQNQSAQPQESDRRSSRRGRNQLELEYTETGMGVNMKFVLVERGEYKMGSKEYGVKNESPVHSVDLNNYYIGVYEVTQSQWQKVMGTTIEQQMNMAGETRLAGVGDDFPMYYVSWEDAREFCERLSAMTGRRYRLPTEAEWEFAARGGKKQTRSDEKARIAPVYSGSRSIEMVAIYGGNSNTTQPVGSKMPNFLGIHDMSGNVYEWCSDWYDKYPMQVLSFSTSNPLGPKSGEFKVLRGGSFNNTPNECRVTHRNFNKTVASNCFYGFRVVMEP